jgi:hypothetical protein
LPLFCYESGHFGRYLDCPYSERAWFYFRQGYEFLLLHDPTGSTAHIASYLLQREFLRC